MKKYSIFTLALNIIILGSCNMKEDKSEASKFSKSNKQRTILPGEWISDIDPKYGISIRDNKMAFFKNMEFSSEDIYNYELIDSLYKFSNRENVVGTYLLAKDLTDTIYYQVIKRSDSSLTLKVNNRLETFNLKRSN